MLCTEGASANVTLRNVTTDLLTGSDDWNDVIVDIPSMTQPFRLLVEAAGQQATVISLRNFVLRKLSWDLRLDSARLLRLLCD